MYSLCNLEMFFEEEIKLKVNFVGRFLLRMCFCFCSIVNFIAAGQHFSDPDAQRSALQVIINCVCGPSARVRKQRKTMKVYFHFPCLEKS